MLRSSTERRERAGTHIPSAGAADARHLRLAIVFAVVAWGIAVVRLSLALLDRERGIDLVLAATVSGGLPCLAILAVLASRSKPTGPARDESGNVIRLRRRYAGVSHEPRAGTAQRPSGLRRR